MATPIKNIVDTFLNHKKQDVVFKENIKQAIYRVIDEQTKHHLYFGKVSKKTLFLYTDASVVHYQLNLLKDKILQEVRDVSCDIARLVIEMRSN